MPWRQPSFRPRRRPPAEPRASSHERGYGSPAWQRVRKAVIARDGGACRACGLILHRPGDCHVDHIERKPVNQAAEATPLSGLQLLCRSCHAKKTADESAS
jgi:5-methylcytosine-specific restriction endonuclease McrA